MNSEKLAELSQRIAKINATAIVLGQRLQQATEASTSFVKVEGAYVLGDSKPPVQGKSFVQGDGNSYGVQKEDGGGDAGSTGPGVGDVHVPAPIGSALNAKATAHNAKAKHDWQRVTPDLLQKVYARGCAAHMSGKQPMSKGAFSMARVDAYLKLLRTGKPDDKDYTQDNDLLPTEHSRRKD